MTLKQLRKTALDNLINMAKVPIERPEVEAALIIMHVLGIDKTALLTKDIDIPEALAIEVNAAVRRRAHGMPVQYIIGKCEFMSLEFKVTPDVLIPRPETELLVETVTAALSSVSRPKVLDIGCGCGCIGISIAHIIDRASVVMLDKSEKAIRVAKQNAEKLGVAHKTEFIESDIMIENLSLGKFDCIVSNPPYIPSGDIEGLQAEVRDYEPRCALDGGDDGLDFYRKISEICMSLKPSVIAFEVGMGQADAAADILYRRGLGRAEILCDIAGIERVVVIK